MQAKQGFLGNFRTGTFFKRFYKKDKNDLPKIPRYTDFFFFFFFFFVFSLSSTYFTVHRGGPWFYYRENYIYFSKESEGVQHFAGVGSNFLQGGGPNAYFYRILFNL